MGAVGLFKGTHTTAALAISWTLVTDCIPAELLGAGKLFASLLSFSLSKASQDPA